MWSGLRTLYCSDVIREGAGTDRVDGVENGSSGRRSEVSAFSVADVKLSATQIY